MRTPGRSLPAVRVRQRGQRFLRINQVARGPGHDRSVGVDYLDDVRTWQPRRAGTMVVRLGAAVVVAKRLLSSGQLWVDPSDQIAAEGGGRARTGAGER